MTVSGWAAHDSSGKITPFTFNRRQNGPTDVTIKVLFCGICHTDIHHVKNDWGITMYPVVPGISQENYCDQVQFTYNGIFWDGSITYGGYSNILVADHRYVVRIPENLAMDKAAPLLCAGITVYCPMKDNKLFESKGKKSCTSPSKEKEAKDHLGADDFIISTNPKHMQSSKRTLDFILDTVAANHSLGSYLELLKVNGTLVVVGAPEKPMELPSFPLIFGKRSVKGSMTGSMKETQEMIDFCGKHNILCDVEMVKTNEINEALDRLAKNDVKNRELQCVKEQRRQKSSQSLHVFWLVVDGGEMRKTRRPGFTFRVRSGSVIYPNSSIRLAKSDEAPSCTSQYVKDEPDSTITTQDSEFEREI
nr:probable cinnamyl alcohol dehydrogenase 6 [Ipomoea batatas]